MPAAPDTDGMLADVDGMLERLWGSKAVLLETLETGEVVTIGIGEEIMVDFWFVDGKPVPPVEIVPEAPADPSM